MTLEQCSSLIKGVLRGWFQNKAILDKFSEGNAGLLYNGVPVFAADDETITQQEMQQAITQTINDLNQSAQPATNSWGMSIGLAPMPTEQLGADNNDTVNRIIMNGSSANIIVDLNDLTEFPSSDPNQGTHKWLALEVKTGCDSIIGVSYNGYALTQQDADDAALTGCEVGSFVLYIRAEEVASSNKIFTLSKDGKENLQVTITVNG